MRIANIKYFSTVNGEGIRTAVFVSGCTLHCPGCFNSEIWSFNNGKEFTSELETKILDSIDNTYCAGLSILGGEPLDKLNQEGVYNLLISFRSKFGNKKNVWLWTGYTLDNIPKTEYTNEILKLVDYIVDGPFKKDLIKPNLPYRGSINQRILENDFGKFIEVEF